jgi:hypothetical protein
MGRIRKLAAWTFSPGGNMKGLVRAESSAERAAREHAELMREQNRLLAQQNRLLASPAPVGAQAAAGTMRCCLECINLGCDQSMGGQVDWTRSPLLCGCPVHHR